MTGAATEHRTIAAAFTATVEAVPARAWENPAPPEGWVARDVVRHLVEWFPAFLRGGVGIDLPFVTVGTGDRVSRDRRRTGGRAPW